MILSKVKKSFKQLLPAGLAASLKYWRAYQRAMMKLGNHNAERQRLFSEMVSRSVGLPAMQVGVRDAKYAPHWVSVDLYDSSPLIDYHYDIHDLKFEDESFNFVACLAVLEHVQTPQKAIAELYRVLKPGGEIWVEVPFNQPYHASPQDYWRVSPDGLRIWMSDFDEIAVGLFAPQGSPIYNGIFFHGKKRGQ
jgi:SAM-dependent methyltransferase